MNERENKSRSRIFGVVFVAILLSFLAMSLPVYAKDSGTILPATTRSVNDCKKLMNYMQTWNSDERKGFLSEREDFEFVDGDGYLDFTFTANDIMACGIKTGSIKLWMIPYYIRYVLTFIIGISGLISVGGIVYGGYLYLFAGLSEAKDQGKKAIKYAVIGLIMTLTAWAVVNIVIALVTG